MPRKYPARPVNMRNPLCMPCQKPVTTCFSRALMGSQRFECVGPRSRCTCFESGVSRAPRMAGSTKKPVIRHAGPVQNKAEELRGSATETAGDVTDNEDLQAEGAAEKAKANVKQTVEDVKDNVEDAADAAKDKADETFNR